MKKFNQNTRKPIDPRQNSPQGRLQIKLEGLLRKEAGLRGKMGKPIMVAGKVVRDLESENALIKEHSAVKREIRSTRETLTRKYGVKFPGL